MPELNVVVVIFVIYWFVDLLNVINVGVQTSKANSENDTLNNRIAWEFDNALSYFTPYLQAYYYLKFKLSKYFEFMHRPILNIQFTYIHGISN